MGRRTVTQSGTQTSYKVRVLEKRAETALLYRLPRPIPLYLTLGYQFAHVNQYDGKIEELSGIMLGAGFGVVP